MKQTFFRRPDVRRRIIYCRPCIDALEARLVLGDTLLGLWALGIYLDTPRFDPESIIAPDPNFQPWVAGAESAAADEVPAEERSLWHRHRGFEDSAPATRTNSDDQAEIGTTGSLVAAPMLATAPVRAFSGLQAWHNSSSYPDSVPISFPNSGLGTPVRESPLHVSAAHETEFPAGVFPNGSSGTRNVVNGTQLQEHYGQLPLSFEANHGQTDARVDFIARTGGATVFLTPTSAVFSMSASRVASAPGGPSAGDELRALTQPGSPESTGGAAVHMEIVGGNPNAAPVGHDQLPGIVNYFIGNDPTKWHTDIPTFGRVEYQDVYPGIDLAYYGRGGQLEYDFIVSPGADPRAIGLNIAGADELEISRQGDLIIHTAAGDVVQQKPYLYQEVNGARQEVAGEFRITNPSPLVSFDVGAYDPARPLVIDPLVLGYSTYLGGGGPSDYAFDIAVDDDGDAFVTGETSSAKFPATPGAYDTTYDGNFDTFVAKLNHDGSALVYATYLGGMNSEPGYAIAIDFDGNAYITGYTHSSDFPTTQGALDDSYNGGGDAYIAKLNATGSALEYATFLGGTGFDPGGDIKVDDNGSAYLIGWTSSIDFPVTATAFDTSYNGGSLDAYVAKLDSTGSALIYATYLGSSGKEFGNGIAVDANGTAYVAGVSEDAGDFPTTRGAFDETYNGEGDAFVSRLSPDGTALLFSTYLGGANADSGSDIALDGSGNAYVLGGTSSANFPTTPGAYDTIHLVSDGSEGFITKLTSAGSALVYSTFFGGGSGGGAGIAVDVVGNVYLAGIAFSGFPVTPDAFDQTNNNSYDACFTKLNQAGSELVYSTYFGGNNSDNAWAIALDSAGNAYFAGQTYSSNFPTTPDAIKKRNRANTADGFVTKFAEV